MTDFWISSSRLTTEGQNRIIALIRDTCATVAGIAPDFTVLEAEHTMDLANDGFGVWWREDTP